MCATALLAAAITGQERAGGAGSPSSPPPAREGQRAEGRGLSAVPWRNSFVPAALKTVTGHLQCQCLGKSRRGQLEPRCPEPAARSGWMERHCHPLAGGRRRAAHPRHSHLPTAPIPAPACTAAAGAATPPGTAHGRAMGAAPGAAPQHTAQNEAAWKRPPASPSPT